MARTALHFLQKKSSKQVMKGKSPKIPGTLKFLILRPVDDAEKILLMTKIFLVWNQDDSNLVRYSKSDIDNAT